MAKKKHSRAKVWTLRVLLTLGLLLGLAMVFNEQIKMFVVKEMSTSTLKSVSRKSIEQNQKKKANFDFDSVSALDLKTVASATMASKDSIGLMAYPAVKLKLPILKGLDNDNMSVGAATMKANDVMGKGNYALAGHDITWNGLLFSALDYAKKGDKIYLTDLKHVFEYRVTKKVLVDMSQVQWVDDVPGKKLITLVTCEIATKSRHDRVIVRGEFVKKTKVTKTNLKLFED
ncbi:class A sortase [Lacticaseibacillus suihuaensis]